MPHPNPGDTRLEGTAEECQSDEVIKLIRKLRWVGLEREVRELQHVLEGSSSPHHGSLVAGPHSTD